MDDFGSARRHPHRPTLAEAYRQVRAASLALTAGLSAEDCMVQSTSQASPVKWHLAHVTWFFETLVLQPWLLAIGKPYQPFRPGYRVLFNSYYVGVGAQFPRAERGLLSRPSLEEILDYRRHIDAQMVDLLRTADPEAAMLRVLELGIHHEQQHQELILTDLKHHFSRNPLLPAFRERAVVAQDATPPPARFVPFKGGKVEIGHRGAGFAFDNECPRHEVWLAPFALAGRPVNNAEFLAFIQDGGYERAELWLADGWDHVQREQWRAPLYWQPDGRIFTLGGTRPLDAGEPACHLSYYEADAFARWAGARLPTEAEWEHGAESSVATVAPDGAAARGNFLDSGLYHPSATMRSPGAADEMAQLLGDVWEWTQSAYLPYPGFRAHAGAVGEYNGKFMINQMVLRGGSCATPASHIRTSYRNFFHPHARWQFSGVRLARSL